MHHSLAGSLTQTLMHTDSQLARVHSQIHFSFWRPCLVWLNFQAISQNKALWEFDYFSSKIRINYSRFAGLVSLHFQITFVAFYTFSSFHKCNSSSLFPWIKNLNFSHVGSRQKISDLLILCTSAALETLYSTPLDGFCLTGTPKTDWSSGLDWGVISRTH